jgi:hypothetical protein
MASLGSFHVLKDLLQRLCIQGNVQQIRAILASPADRAEAPDQ